MTQRNNPGPLDLGSLAQLHRPVNAKQYESARFAARQSLAAVRAIDSTQLSTDTYIELTRVASTLAGAITQLELLAGRV